MTRTLRLMSVVCAIAMAGKICPAGSVNYISNGDFEAGYGHGTGIVLKTRNFTFFSAWDKSEAHHGKASMRIDPWGSLETSAIPVPGGRPYTLSVWVKPSAPATIKLALHNVCDDLGAPRPKATTAPSNVPAGKLPTYLEQSFKLVEGWQQIKISGTLSSYPTSDYHAMITATSVGLWADQMQLEEGDLTEFKPRSPLEVGLVCDKVSNIFLEGEPVTMPLLAHNGSAKDIAGKVGYEVYDFLNRKVKSGSVDATVRAGETWQGALDLSTGKRGAFRVVLWVEGQDGTEEEVVFSVVAKPKVVGPDPTSIIGIHASTTDHVLTAMQKLGMKWQRSLSPDPWARWGFVEPEQGKFTWYDEAVRRTVGHDMQILACIHGWWPAWALKEAPADPAARPAGTVVIDYDKKSQLLDLDAWEAYVFALVSHYKDSIHYWEVCNEPVHAMKPEAYVEVLKRATRAIRKADPTAKIVGMGGSYDCAWQLGVIKGLGDKPKDFMDLISTHLYPPGADPFNPSHDTRGLEYHDKIIVPYDIEVWNTETGPWCGGMYQGLNSNYRLVNETGAGNKAPEVAFRGFNFEAERTVYNFMHTVGNGMTKYFYYDARPYQGPDYYKTHCTILHYDDTIRTKGIAYAVLAWLFDHSKGLGNISAVPKTREEFRAATTSPTTHEVGDLGSDVKVYAYLFDRSGVPLVAIWSSDTKNRTLKLALDAAQFKAYDMMGNEIKTTGGVVSFGRAPIYLEGQGKLTVEDLKAAVRKGRLAEVPDKTPPNLSISEGPRGAIDRTSVRFRWVAADETYVPAVKGVGDPNAVTYSYRLVGRDKDWSAWTSRMFVCCDTLPPGDYQFEVKARDGAGNACEPVVRKFSVVKVKG